MKHTTTNHLFGLFAATTLCLATATAADLPVIPTLPTPAKPDGKEADMSKPVQVFILLGQSNMVGMGEVGGDEPGSLKDIVKTKNKYSYLLDEAGNWSERKDVRNVRVISGRRGGMQVPNNEWMTIKGKIGPEIGIGHYLGDATDAPVMLLKSCNGNRSLGWDLMPPGTEPYEYDGDMTGYLPGKIVPGYRGTPENPKGNGQKVEGAWYAGKQYDEDTDFAKNVLAKLNEYYPGATKYEVAGFFFWQGEKDCGVKQNADRYQTNLVNFIKALRKDFNAPNAKFVLATLGEGTKGCGGNGEKVLEAQLAVDGATGKYPEFKGNVATVFSNPLSMGGSGNGHYEGNPQTYMNVGEAMGKAMLGLMKN
ncbi:MAG: sialate O-acetylesterase [Akkermansiaceae bacterium]|nr:sialate O-acetylesterase [Akkermansiaceae bacterium]MCF7732005.1 sialate O-acetylesterase [Akkermansiaceae bacterium]